MQSVSANSYNYNDFNFSMQTSSGDKVDLKLYDETSSQASIQKDGNTTTTSLTLTHSYGYSFNYEGNGIDKNDKKEIEEAMKVIQPMLVKYFENINQSEKLPSEADVTNKAFDINSYLPKAHDSRDNNNEHDYGQKNNNYDQNTKNYLNDSTLKTIDKILEKVENQTEKILNEAQKLFDKLLKQADRFELYM